MKTSAKTLKLSRGQSLVLMGLNMLLLTLLVCMTLSFGQKAKEKMELQMMADQAAYSTSVATARAFNELAIMNRAIIADNVTMLGVDASISFTTLVFGILDWLLLDYFLELGVNQVPQCDPPWQWCGCFGIFGVIFGRIWPIWMRGWATYGMFMGLDVAAAQQANAAASVALFQWAMQGVVMAQMYTQRLNNQNQARNAVNVSSAGNPEISVPSGGDSVTMSEVGIIPFTGAINLTNAILSDRHGVAAAMGSRTHPWTAGRLNIDGFSLSGSGQVLSTYYRMVTAGDDAQIFSDGAAYFSMGPLHGDNLLLSASSWAVSDDHLFHIVTYRGIGCSGIPWPGISVAGVEGNDGFSVHMGSGMGDIWGFPMEALYFVIPWWPWFWDDAGFHTVPSLCLLNCPSAWSNFVDYDDRKLLPSFGGIGGGWQDNWGQPKTPVTVQRNYANRPGRLDPWDMAFHLNWGGRSTDLNMKENYGAGGNNGVFLNPVTSGCGSNCDISKQTALSTGITYYHRGGGHFKEPPNLFNPWWKAGLIHSDADKDASPQHNGCGGDMLKQITDSDSNAGWITDAARNLCAQGYRGWQ